MRCFKFKKTGFTLVELLATLTIMAIIAAILFPFIAQYNQKANRDTMLRSLRMLQDSMDRYRSLTNADWPLGTGQSGTGDFDVIRQLDTNDVNLILYDITAPGISQTMEIPAEGVMYNRVVVVSTDTNARTSGWEVLRYRRSMDINGIDRKGNEVLSNFLTPSSADIDAAFQNQ